MIISRSLYQLLYRHKIKITNYHTVHVFWSKSTTSQYFHTQNFVALRCHIHFRSVSYILDTATVLHQFLTASFALDPRICHSVPTNASGALSDSEMERVSEERRMRRDCRSVQGLAIPTSNCEWTHHPSHCVALRLVWEGFLCPWPNPFWVIGFISVRSLYLGLGAVEFLSLCDNSSHFRSPFVHVVSNFLALLNCCDRMGKYAEWFHSVYICIYMYCMCTCQCNPKLCS